MSDADRVLARRTQAAAHTARADAARLARWEALLTDLDTRAADAEHLLWTAAGEEPAPQSKAVQIETVQIETARPPWSAPLDVGGLPPELLARAAAVASHQQEVLDKLAAAAMAHRKEAKLVDTMKMDGDAVPVYVDQAG